MDHQHIQRRGVPKPTPPKPPLQKTSNGWIQILGFPPDMWTQVRNQIELKCGHVVEEVRHPSCNWCIVRFASATEADTALSLNEVQWTPGIWLYVTRLTDAQAHSLSFPANAPLVFSPDVERKPITRSSGFLSPRDFPAAIVEEDVAVEGWYGATENLRKFVNSRLAKYYIIPITEKW